MKLEKIEPGIDRSRRIGIGELPALPGAQL